MRNLPFMPYWVADEGDRTAHLTFEEEGVYIRLLRISWANPGCQIPDDKGWIMRRMRASDDCDAAVVWRILEEFFERKDGAWRNPALRSRYEIASKASLGKAEAGRKGGLARAQKMKGRSPSSVNDLPEAGTKQTLSKPDSESISRNACSRAHIDRIRRSIGPRPGAREISDADIATVVTEWLALDATEDEIVSVVRQRTANASWARINSLRALRSDIAAAVAGRPKLRPQVPAQSPKPLVFPDAPSARECLNAIIERFGRAAAEAWLSGAPWTADKVLLPAEFTRQQVDQRFGSVLLEHGFSAGLQSS